MMLVVRMIRWEELLRVFEGEDGGYSGRVCEEGGFVVCVIFIVMIDGFIMIFPWFDV